MSAFGEEETVTFINNPNQVLDISVPLAKPLNDIEFVSQIKVVTTTIVQGWKGHNNHISISVLSGGITNALYIVENLQRSEKVIVRLFGSGTDLFIDRRIENEVFAYLSAHGMAPVFHGLFANGRVEGFLNARNLIPNEFSHPKIASGVARAMAQLHAQSIVLSRESSIWSKTKHILLLLQDVNFQSPSMQASIDTLDIPRLKESAAALEAELVQKEASLEMKGSARSDYEDGQFFGMQVAFTHNDLLSGNVLIPLDFFENEESTEVKFIDYEYAGFNPRAFDVANHFCEYAGFDFDMDADFPKKDKRDFFIRTYSKCCGGCKDSDDFLNGFENAVLQHVLVSHIFWGSWAVLQASISTIDFDFMDYAKKRIAAYYKHQVEFSGASSA